MLFYINFNINSIETNWYVSCSAGGLSLERFTAKTKDQEQRRTENHTGERRERM